MTHRDIQEAIDHIRESYRALAILEIWLQDHLEGRDRSPEDVRRTLDRIVDDLMRTLKRRRNYELENAYEKRSS